MLLVHAIYIGGFPFIYSVGVIQIIIEKTSSIRGFIYRLIGKGVLIHVFIYSLIANSSFISLLIKA